MNPTLLMVVAAFACLSLYMAAWGQSVPITLRLDRRVGFAPLDVRAEVHVARHEANRVACMAIGNGAYEAHSCWPVEGIEAQTVYTRDWTGLPAGRYAAGAWVERTTETLRTPLQELMVLGE